MSSALRRTRSLVYANTPTGAVLAAAMYSGEENQACGRSRCAYSARQAIFCQAIAPFPAICLAAPWPRCLRSRADGEKQCWERGDQWNWQKHVWRGLLPGQQPP